jgi:hypothetical protein
MLYRVRVGRDEYLGTAEEVVAFLARAEGAPGRDPRSYMEGVAARLADRLGVSGVATSDPTRFLEDLLARRVLPIERRPEPSDDRDPVDPRRLLADGPVTLGEGVDADDLPL